jgi:hypothetical protein
MRHDLTLQMMGSDNIVHQITWDDETGELSGPDVEWAKDVVANVIGRGTILCRNGGTIPVTDPLHDKVQFAGIFGWDSAPDEITRWQPDENSPGFMPRKIMPGALTLEELGMEVTY